MDFIFAAVDRLFLSLRARAHQNRVGDREGAEEACLAGEAIDGWGVRARCEVVRVAGGGSHVNPREMEMWVAERVRV